MVQANPSKPSTDIPTGADLAQTSVFANSSAEGAPALTSSVRYHVGAEIARGGMGVVYRATDAVLGREVAVKVLRDQRSASTGAARRFADEARIAAQLQHPAIPPVHDLGALPDGRPFLAMKLIEGDTLDQLLQQRPDPEHNRGRLVAVFEQVCQAVGFAHSRGVIHRDLKPANIMVGAFGEVQVMDWGIAKDLTRSEHERPARPSDALATTTAGPDETTDHRPTEDRTRLGQAIGTPSYMPPEQARGEPDKIDRRSDVFALGGVLCAILTGRPPYVVAGVANAIRMATEGALAETWSRLDASGADAELVSLCKRCLAVGQDDRPADGGAVASLVAEYRASVEERLRAAERERAAAEAKAGEQRKKRQVQLALAAAVVMLLAGGGAFAWYSDRQATAERDRLARSTEAVLNLLDQAEVSLRANDAARAGQLLDAAENRSSEAGAQEAVARLDQLRADWAALVKMDEADRLRWSVARGRRQTKAAAVGYREALAAVGADPIGVSPEVVAAQVNRSAVQERLLAALDWVLCEERSPKVRAALRAADPDAFRTAVRDADAVDDRKAVADLAGRPETARQPARFVALLGEAGFIPGATRRKLVAEALRLQPGDLGLLMALCYAHHPEAQGVPAHQLRFAQAATAIAPANPIPHIEMGMALYALGELDEATREYRTAMRLDPTLPYPHNNLANALFKKGDVAGALAELKEAVRLDPEYASAHSNLGVILTRLDDEEGAAAEYRAAIRLDRNNTDAHYNYGNLLYKMGDLEGAVKEYREAMRLSPSFAPAHNNLGNPLFRLGRVEEALKELREGIRLDPKRPNPHNTLGTILHDLGDLDGAETEFKETLRLDAKHASATRNLARVARHRMLLPRLAAVIAGTDRPATAAEAVEFADLCRMPFQKRYATAVRLFDKAFAGDPKLAVQVSGGDTRRLAAAMAAVRAGRGDGADAPAELAARAALRAKALAWLRTTLADYQRRAASSSQAERKQAAAELTSWLRNTEFAAVLPGPKSVEIPTAEQAEWNAFWSEVRSTIAQDTTKRDL